MTRKSDAQEHLLNVVARELGQAAGTLANMTHMLTADKVGRESGSASKPESVNAKAVNKDTSPASARQNPKKQRPPSAKKRTRSAKPQMASRRNTGTKQSSEEERLAGTDGN
jgi:hypothetical protein